jgi:hypothetical protein
MGAQCTADPFSGASYCAACGGLGEMCCNPDTCAHGLTCQWDINGNLSCGL